MIKLAKLLATTLAIVLILSISVKGKTLFAHIYAVIAPVTENTQDAVEDLAAMGYRTTSGYARKLFSNSLPKMNDSVKSGLSAVRKNGPPEEDVTIEEKQELDQLIKTHR